MIFDTYVYIGKVHYDDDVVLSKSRYCGVQRPGTSNKHRARDGEAEAAG